MNKAPTSDSTVEDDVAVAIESLNQTTFKGRFRKPDNDTSESESKSSSDPLSEQFPAEQLVDQLNRFKKDVQAMTFDHFRDGVFQKFFDRTFVAIAFKHWDMPVVPAERDLLHVYGPDRNNTKDWKKYYRYVWRTAGPYPKFLPPELRTIYDQEMIQEGKLHAGTDAYSGQSSFAIVGTGILFRPQFGDSKVSVRPLVQWMAVSSFTGDRKPATAIASIGIYIESWSKSGGGYYVDRDYWIPVWSHNTNDGYLSEHAVAGDANSSDGLSTEFLAVAQRKYAIYIYLLLETTASPIHERNDYRYVRLDMEATIPFVVVEETLIS